MTESPLWATGVPSCWGLGESVYSQSQSCPTRVEAELGYLPSAPTGPQRGWKVAPRGLSFLLLPAYPLCPPSTLPQPIKFRVKGTCRVNAQEVQSRGVNAEGGVKCREDVSAEWRSVQRWGAIPAGFSSVVHKADPVPFSKQLNKMNKTRDSRSGARTAVAQSQPLVSSRAG